MGIPKKKWLTVIQHGKGEYSFMVELLFISVRIPTGRAHVVPHNTRRENRILPLEIAFGHIPAAGRTFAASCHTAPHII